MTSEDREVDGKEQSLTYPYQDLADFIVDYQATRSGKPTKKMLAEIRDWNPNLDLQQASRDQRIKWRRSCTINWLYDLVNLFSSGVVKRNNIEGNNLAYDKVDWSFNGPQQDRRLYGLNESAGVVTTFAMQKPGTDIRRKILPHHVIQMQCIVDSMTVSRGWSNSVIWGDVTKPPASSFRPRRDIDLFLDRNYERPGHGYLHAVDFCIDCFRKDAKLHGDPERHQYHVSLLILTKDHMIRFLGESPYVSGLDNVISSRFSNPHANGLQEYSPFLCGVGLAEILELVYSINFSIWDDIPEPDCIIHLYNMLVQKGRIESEDSHWATALQKMLQTSFFVDGKVPDRNANFAKVFGAVHSQPNSPRATFERHAITRHHIRTRGEDDLSGHLDVQKNFYYRTKSLLKLYTDAEWISDRIPDEAVELYYTGLSMNRLAETRILKDPATGKKVLEDTPITRRYRAQGKTDEDMMKYVSERQRFMSDRNARIGFKATFFEEGSPSKGIRKDGGHSTRLSQLESLKRDMIMEISSHGFGQPISNVNYIFISVVMMVIFQDAEKELKRVRNPLWVKAYERDTVLTKCKR